MISGTTYHGEEYFEASYGVNNPAISYEGRTVQSIYGPYPSGAYVFSKGISKKRVETGDVIAANIYSLSTGAINLGELVITITDANGTQVGWYPINLGNNNTTFVPKQNSITFNSSSLNAIPSRKPSLFKQNVALKKQGAKVLKIREILIVVVEE